MKAMEYFVKCVGLTLLLFLNESDGVFCQMCRSDPSVVSMYIKKWYLFYSSNLEKVQQAVGQLTKQPIDQIIQIPWGHNIAIITKCKGVKEALYYVQNTIKNNWSRSVLVHQLLKIS